MNLLCFSWSSRIPLSTKSCPFLSPRPPRACVKAKTLGAETEAEQAKEELHVAPAAGRRGRRAPGVTPLAGGEGLRCDEMTRSASFLRQLEVMGAAGFQT